MVTSQFNTQSTTIILSPNRSVTWRESKIIVSIMAVFVLLVALCWAFVGAWIILPFAGFEVGLLALLMYRVNLHCHSKQVITIADGKIIVQSGIKRPTLHWEFDKALTQLNVKEAETEFERTELALTDQMSSLPVGEFLNQQDSLLARDYLKQAGIIEVSNKWWKKQH